ANAAAIKAIERSLAAIDRSIAAGESAVAEDFAFHQSIAKATGNTHFISFLTFLGAHVIPRQSIRSVMIGSEQAAYLQRIQSEHAEIATAIKRGDSTRARKAMRLHLA